MRSRDCWRDLNSLRSDVVGPGENEREGKPISNNAMTKRKLQLGSPRREM